MIVDHPPADGDYLNHGDWIAWDDFGEFHSSGRGGKALPDFEADEEGQDHLPRLEWEADLELCYPHADRKTLRQLIRLWRAAREWHDLQGGHLNLYGALGELFAAASFGIQLHRKPNAQGSDGRLKTSFVEIKTIGPRSVNERVRVKLSGNFGKLAVVRITPDFRLDARLVERTDLTSATSGHAGICWSRACRVGRSPEEVGADMAAPGG